MHLESNSCLLIADHHTYKPTVIRCDFSFSKVHNFKYSNTMESQQIFQDQLLNSLVNPNWKNSSLEVEKDKAYQEGFKKGLDAKELEMKNFFFANIDKVMSIGETLFKEFNKLQFECSEMLLKPRDLKSFEVLFIVEEKIYLSQTRKEVYKLIRNLKKEHNSSEFQFECLIMPQSSEINMNLILSEGFSLKYEPKSR